MRLLRASLLGWREKALYCRTEMALDVVAGDLSRLVELIRHLRAEEKKENL